MFRVSNSLLHTIVPDAGNAEVCTMHSRLKSGRRHVRGDESGTVTDHSFSKSRGTMTPSSLQAFPKAATAHVIRQSRRELMKQVRV